MPQIGRALRQRRRERGLTQPQLARCVDRSTPRISELETHLLGGRPARDRLGLLLELCDALDLVPVLIPRERAQGIQRLLPSPPTETAAPSPGRAFDDVFVDLSADDDTGEPDDVPRRA
jgi:transcriptional regulator with XRE-family HTH domain